MKLRNSTLCNLGRLAFLFFLVKGLAWLALPAILAWWGLAGTTPGTSTP